MTDPLGFLEAVTGFAEAGTKSSADRPVKLATIDPAYSPWVDYPSAPPPARVTFDGETALSGKAYGYASGFIPWAGMRVFMVPIGNSYLIGGALNPQSPQGFWQNAAGTESGVEFGGGSYYDTDEGLVIAGDAAVQRLDVSAGRGLVHGPRNNVVPEILFGNTNVTGATLGVGGGSLGPVQVNFGFTYPAGTSLTFPAPGISGVAGSSAHSMARVSGVTLSGFQLYVLKTDAARTPYVAADSMSVHWCCIASVPAT